MTFEPYWRAAVPFADIPTDPLTGSAARVDVAVVGGGYTGLSAARVLARSGASVIVLERAEIGGGASSRNAGQVLTGLKADAATLVRRHGESRARELFEASRAAMAGLERVVEEESIDCALDRTGHLQAAWKPSHFEAFRNEQKLLARVFDHHVELIPASGQHTELGSARYHGLMVDPASMSVHPGKYVHGLAEAAARAGARLTVDVDVTRIERAGPRWALSTPKGNVDAKQVLIATNGYTGGVTPGLQRRLVPIGSYIVVTEPLGADLTHRLIPRRRMVFDTKNFLYYFRLTPDDRLLFGGRTQFGPVTAASTRHAADMLRRAAVDVFPQLSGARIDYAWSGSVGFTWDELPHAGQMGGLFYAAGYCGHGIAMATMLGEVIARHMTGEAVRHPLLNTAFPPVPLYRGKPWFLPLVGAYYRVKDWMG